MPKFNDIDLSRWREMTDIITDSLWLINKRDNSGSHSGHYHGNFVPQVINQLMKRYTKTGDWVIDPFMGSGTTLIEAQRLARNAIGIELDKSVAAEARDRIDLEQPNNVTSQVYVGDSQSIDVGQIVRENHIDKFQFAIFHPPYWDIIHFTDSKKDLSNTPSLDAFLKGFGNVIDNVTQYLEPNRYCAVVIGDKYQNSQVVPLGFHCMNLFLERGFTLKAILVKDFGETRGKLNMQQIWRYRSLASDYYIFKHEYIFVFKKPAK